MKIDRKVYFYCVAIAIVLVYGTIGAYLLGQGNNFNVKINSAIEALYFTVVTISTVGYGDIVPVTNLGRIFDIVLIISGLSIFLSALTVLSGEFLSSRMEKLYTGLSAPEKRRMKNHIVLIGYDTTNALIAERLKGQRRNFIIISSDKLAIDSLRAKGYPAFLADYTIKAEMERFELSRATDIVIDLRDSSKTVYVVLVVKKLIKDSTRISVIAYNADMEMHLSDLEINKIINPITIAADELTKELDRDQDSDSKAKKLEK